MIFDLSKLPRLSQPKRYEGLYIFDFGSHVSVGYTLKEVQYLLSDERFKGGKAYKIYRAYPDGKLELVGISKSQIESMYNMIFWFDELHLVENAYNELVNNSSQYLGLEEFAILVYKTANNRYILVLSYPAGSDNSISDWLIRINFVKGKLVEVAKRLDTNVNIIETLFEKTIHPSKSALKSRSREEVLSSTDRIYQR